MYKDQLNKQDIPLPEIQSQSNAVDNGEIGKPESEQNDANSTTSLEERVE